MIRQSFFALVALGAVFCSNAHASALLKPVSGPTQTLRLRALDVSTQVDGAWAKTTVTALYARKSRQSIEADLLYTAPPNSVVTGFAYWHGREKVVARVTERERADEISQASLNGEIDPAWVQLVGKKVFRARLHSILPKRDLRVEISFVQPLENEGPTDVWNYPLVSETRDVTLDWLRVRLNVENGFQTRNNFGANASQNEISLKKYNFKPKTDLRLALPVVTNGLQAQLSTEHRIGADGKAANEAYFALTLRSKNAVNAAPQIEGVETFDILPAQRRSASEIRLFGRYRGKGTAKISWGDAATLLWFSPASDAGNEVSRLAAPLWAVARLQTFAGDGRERSRSIALSKAFNLPTKWTNWVAIPAKERKVIEARLQQLDLARRGANLGRIWAVEVEKNEPLGARALQARAGLRSVMRSSLGRKYGFDEESTRAQAVKTRLGELARLVMAARMDIRPREKEIEANFNRLAGFALENTSPYLQNAQSNLRELQVQTVAKNWTREVVALRGNAPGALKLKKQLKTLQNRYGNEDDFETSAYRRAAQQMAYAAFNEAIEGRENGPRATQLIDAGERFARRSGSGAFAMGFYNPIITANLQKAGEQLIGEIEAGRDRSDQARDAEIQMQRLYALAPALRANLRQTGSIAWQVNVARRGLASETAYRIVQLRARRPDDRKSLAPLETQLERLAARTEDEPDDFLKTQNERFGNGEALQNAHDFRLEASGLDSDNENQTAPTKSAPRLAISADEPLLSLQLPLQTRHVEAILPSGETQNLNWNAQNGRFETRLYAPHFERAGKLAIALRVVDSSGKIQKWKLNWSFGDNQIAPENPQNQTWQIGVWSAQTQSVNAILPWKTRVTLPALPSGQFFAPIKVPATWNRQKPQIRLQIENQNLQSVEIVLDYQSSKSP